MKKICTRCKNQSKCSHLICFCGNLHWGFPFFDDEEIPLGCAEVVRTPQSEEDCVGFEEED